MDLSIGLDQPVDRVDVGEALKALAAGATPETVKFLQQAADRHADISAWLAKNPDAMEQFKTAPLSVLAKQFPELQLPKGRVTPISGIVAGRVNFGRLEPQTAAAALLATIAAWVATAPANADQFHADPFAVVTAQSAGYSAAVVDQVRNAISTALGMPSITHFLDVTDAVRLGRI
jgi:hypothetical protein